MSVRVLALDLERTLIDNALSGLPRPGLRDFLAFCHSRFDRVVVFSTVEETDAREVLEGLAGNGYVPSELLRRLEYVGWYGEHKDVAFIADAMPEEVLLVDDDAGWVRPDQRDQWVGVAAWDGGPDSELTRVQSVLEIWLSADRPRDA